MALDYITKRETNGAAIQLCRVGGSRYLRVIRVSDGKVAASWSGAPFAGKLADAYAAFDAAMTQAMPEGDTFTDADRVFGESLGRILERTGNTSYAVRETHRK